LTFQIKDENLLAHSKEGDSMKILFAIILMISLNSFGQAKPAAQFKHGQNISVKEMSGDVSFYCKNDVGNNFTKHYDCYAAEVDPGTQDYFVSNVPVDADNVTLVATHADGSQKTKKVMFNSEKSSTLVEVNLLTRTLLQSPLLRAGENNVTYQFTKDKKVVLEGAFPFLVNILESKKCHHRSAFGTYNECQNQNMGCNTYFYLEHNCNY
jgi:hypothetical protein